MPDDVTSKEPSARDVHIAQRKAQLREEIRHFGNTTKVATVAAEKEDAQARVEVAQVLLKTLESL
jgi:hypothetical protein